MREIQDRLASKKFRDLAEKLAPRADFLLNQLPRPITYYGITNVLLDSFEAMLEKDKDECAKGILMAIGVVYGCHQLETSSYRGGGTNGS